MELTAADSSPGFGLHHRPLISTLRLTARAATASPRC